MDIETLGFTCRYCGTRLLVPVTVAGVEGPCPKCGSLIRAPRYGLFEVLPEDEEAPVRLEVGEPAIPLRPKPVPVLTPAAEVPMVGSAAGRSQRRMKVVRIVTCCLFGFALLAGGILLVRHEHAAGRPKPARREAAVQPFLGEAVGVPVAPDPPVDSAVPPEGVDVHALTAAAASTASTFLEARTLEERLPLLETEVPVEEMKTSVLAGPLPAASRFAGESVKFNKIEGYADVVFQVAFQGQAGGDQLLLVRVRGTQDPKVVVEPFLDGYGGRLAAFAAGPQDGERTLRTVVSIFDFCNSPEVPNPENKKTVKLSRTRGGTDLFKAYFGKASPLGGKLERMGLKYGLATPATLTLKWNTREDPSKPFIEVMDVKSLDWN